MATDFLTKFETDSLPGGDIIQCKASGAIVQNDVVLLVTAAGADEIIPTVKASDANDSTVVFGVAMTDAASGALVQVKRKWGLAKVKITCSTVAIVVGDKLASDNGGGAKEAAAATSQATVFATALQASVVQNDEILVALE